MAPCGECHRAGGLAGLGGSVCPRVRPAPTAQQCTQRQEFSLGGGHPSPLRPLSCTPCPPCTPALHAHVDGQLCVGRRSAVGGGSWCWSRALTRTLRVPLAGVGGVGAAAGAGTRVPLRRSPCWHRAEGLSRDVPALGADKPGELLGEAEGQSSTAVI